MAEYVAQGDGWDIALPLMNDDHPIIRAAMNGDTAEVRRQMSLGVSLARAMYHPSCIGDANMLTALLEAGGNGEVNARGDIGWTALGAAAMRGNVECVALLLAAGADPDRLVSNLRYHHTPLQLAVRPLHALSGDPQRRGQVLYLLLRAGATMTYPDTARPYLSKVSAAGGFRAYERAHRTRLAAMLARVIFPRLPVDALSHVAAFAFHTGAAGCWLAY